MTRESRVTWRAGRDRSWESRGFGRGGSGRSFSLFDRSTGVMLSRKVSMSAASLPVAVPVGVGSLSALVLDFPFEETGGLRAGGVCGMAVASRVLDLAEVAVVLMFNSGRRLALRRPASGVEEYMLEEIGQRG